MMTKEQKLRQLIKEANQCLTELDPYTTKVAKISLFDMIQKAKDAIEISSQNENQNCDKTLAFTTKRQFGDWHWTKEDACQFAIRRYTMASVWLNEEKVYSTYGLADALEWYKEQDLRKPLKASELDHSKKGYLSIEDTWNYYENLCQEFLTDISYGNEIGQYSRQAGEKLIRSLKYLRKLREKYCQNFSEKLNRTLNKEEFCKKEIATNGIAEALVDCLNALWELRISCVLRSEIKEKSDGNIFCSAKQMEEIRKRIETDSLINEQYKKIKEIADSASLEQRKSAYRALFEPDDYKRLNREFVIETSAGNRASFSVPKKTVSASFSFVLPKEDNEKDGLGSIRVWNIGLKASEGENIHMTNNEAITLCNPSKSHEDSWTYPKPIYLNENALYTVMFDAKQDGKFKKGMQICLTFFDKDGNKLGTHEEIFNRKAWLDVKKYDLYTQCDAICYWYTSDKVYAEKSKIEMLHFLDDFCQGAHHWIRYNERPEGSDAYGGVQGGRILFTIAVAYSMIKNSGVWSDKEQSRFYELISYLLDYLADLRDRTLMTKERTQRGSSNWQTDMHIGIAAMMMALPDFPNRKIWLYNSESVLRSQLDYKVNADGSWPESLRYHFASLEHFALYARLWQRESGQNWFASKKDTPGLIEMFRYPLYTQTPPYAYFNDCIATPPFGDHKLGDGSEFALYGLYCEQVSQYNKEIANKLYATWCRAKRPVKGFWGESVALENLMYPTQTDTIFVNIEKENEDKLTSKICGANSIDPMAQILALGSNCQFSNSGIYIFRDHFGTRKENYLAVMSSPKKIGHGHLDQGSFIYYYHCVPIVMDSGIEGYFEASTLWHICSYSHAVMQFASENKEPVKRTEGFINLTAGTYSLERGWNDGPDHSEVKKLGMNEEAESIFLKIENPKGYGIDHRTITMDHQKETLTIEDKITDFSGEVLFNLPLLAKCVTRNDNEFIVENYGDVETRIMVHSKMQSVLVETGRATVMAPDSEDHTNLWYLRIKAKAEDGFLITIEPHETCNKGAEHETCIDSDKTK